LSQFSVSLETTLGMRFIRATKNQQPPTSQPKYEYEKEPFEFPLFIDVQIDRAHVHPQHFHLTLILKEDSVIDSSVHPSIHECLLEIQGKLPEFIRMESCWNCARSMYSPLSKSEFGGLGCFFVESKS